MPITTTIEKTPATFYFEGERATAVSFKKERGAVQFCKLEEMEEEEIVKLIKSLDTRQNAD